MRCLRGRVLPDFSLNSYRSCDNSLIVKTLPFAECTVSDYTFLSQACSEQGKASTSIAFVPRYFFIFLCRYSKRQKVVTCLGTLSGPEGGTSATKIDKDERNFHCWAPNGAPKGMLCKKKSVARDSSLRWLEKICKDIQKYLTKIYEILEFGLSCFFRCLWERDHFKEPSKYLETWELKHAKSCWRNIFSKADHLERKNQERTNSQRAKDQRLLFIHSLVQPWQCDSTCRITMAIQNFLWTL